MLQLRYLIVICVFTPSYFVYSQVVNLAFGKNTNSTQFRSHQPSFAVDGSLSQNQYSCGHTAYNGKQKVAWWQVDLAVIADIINITIYYRENIDKDKFIAVRRLNGFQITVEMNTTWNTEAACYRDNVTVYPLNITTIDICTGPGRYVTIFNYHFDDKDKAYGPILELCEVQVFGCTPNKYGTECTLDCHCKQKGCQQRNGVCFLPGCEAGWKGTSCNKTCKTGEFGQDCKFTCHCLNGSCPRETGLCNGGCKPGWLNKTCSQPCEKNTFGENCTLACHCKAGSCNNTDGQCYIQGCKPGWKGYICSTQCTGNEFGEDCKKTCHCLNGTCNPMNGSCYVAGCEPGYLGEACNKQCENNFYGLNCSLKCFCKEGTCNFISGECNRDMCKDGWKGKTCSEKCENGTFGLNCASKCHCFVGTCNNENGKCIISGCKDGWEGSTCSEVLNSKTLPVILGVLVGSLSFILVAVLVLIYIFRRKRSAESTKDVDVSQPKLDDALDHVYHELGLSENTEYAVIQTDDNKETTYINYSCDNNILRMRKIRDEVTVKIQNGTLQEQHKSIPLGPLHPQTAGKLLKNRKKNRNRNILPYDHSRVILDTSNQDPDADYINASYINGLIKDSKYIATQGPMKNTVEDFWRMIWQTKSSVIVMLTNVIEQNQVTCFQYWPVPSSVLGIPGYEITLLEDQMRSEFIIRKLKVKNIKTGEVRKMCLLQFTSWPKQSVPHPYQLYLLLQKYAEIISTNNSGPAIIHCGDGSDRTGVFIAFDAISQCCYRNEIIDICQLVTDMRKNRMNMVATEECYVFLHKLFLEYLLFRDTNIPKHDFRTAIKEECNNIEREYEVLVNNLPQYDDTFYKEALLKKNRGKNRNNCILPVETYRLILSKAGAGHYINAISVPSCRMSRQFLVTQIPFANTVVDLWNMISEYNSCTVVSLEDAPSFEKDLIWHPLNENKLDLGKLMLTKTSESMAIPGTKEINLNVLEKEKNDGKLIKLYQYLNWRHGSATPAPQTSFLDFIHLVLTWNKSNNNDPITVICSDGARCCGLFCLVYSIIENLSFSDNIDIFQMARLQQIRRPQFFSVEQYQFCYKVVQDYLEKAQLYSEAE